MGNYKKKLFDIIQNDYGVHSGVYSVVDPKIRTVMNKRGEYRPIFTGKETEDTYKKLLEVDMMSDETPNETQLGEELFNDVEGIKYDEVLGYYSDLYVGHVIESDFRSKGSSGGLTTWILTELFKKKMIDGVIHVHATNPKKNAGKLFKYVISDNERDIKAGAKSRYYPMELSEVLQTIKIKQGKFAVVGIPEFVTELRLLSRQDPIIKSKIKFIVGLVCGHQKTANYTEALAWQQGIDPGKLQSVDFRVKQAESTASNYLHQFTANLNGKKTTITRSHEELFVGKWAHGFFKSNFSDFSDNVFNELADVVLGDAWLDEYNNDGMGNNIVIVRNQEVANIIKEGILKNKLYLDVADEHAIQKSQLGLIHHARDELPYRLYKKKMQGCWVPKKRVQPSSDLGEKRKIIQDLRYEMATTSHEVYLKAKELKSWNYFKNSMSKLVDHYEELYANIDSQEQIKTINDSPKQSLVKNAGHIPRSIKKYLVQIKRRTRVRTRIKRMVSEWSKKRDKDNHDGAILTLTGYYNYGNIMQRFALQEFLRQNGYQFISYINDQLKVVQSNPKRLSHTKRFVERYIATKQFDANDKFKTYIVGSDQVWRNWGYEDECRDLGYYFLNFIKERSETKRIAYAVSMGTNEIGQTGMSPYFIDYARPYVQKFNSISVREKTALRMTKELWGVDACKVVDPTMLLETDVYSELIKDYPHSKGNEKTIFAYILIMNDQKEQIIRKITEDNKDIVDEFFVERFEVLPPVEIWLRGFRNSELVITDSFHGTVFSILYNTPFLVIESQEGGLSRVEDLLSDLNLNDRLIRASDSDKFNYSELKPIDWRAVNGRLESLKKKSREWLLKELNS